MADIKATAELYSAQKGSADIVYVYFVPAVRAKIGIFLDIFVSCLYFLMESSFPFRKSSDLHLLAIRNG